MAKTLGKSVGYGVIGGVAAGIMLIVGALKIRHIHHLRHVPKHINAYKKALHEIKNTTQNMASDGDYLQQKHALKLAFYRKLMADTACLHAFLSYPLVSILQTIYKIKSFWRTQDSEYLKNSKINADNSHPIEMTFVPPPLFQNHHEEFIQTPTSPQTPINKNQLKTSPNSKSPGQIAYEKAVENLKQNQNNRRQIKTQRQKQHDEALPKDRQNTINALHQIKIENLHQFDKAFMQNISPIRLKIVEIDEDQEAFYTPNASFESPPSSSRYNSFKSVDDDFEIEANLSK